MEKSNARVTLAARSARDDDSAVPETAPDVAAYAVADGAVTAEPAPAVPAQGAITMHHGRIGAYLLSGRAPVRLAVSALLGPPTTGLHAVGELHADGSGALYFCTTGGLPGLWKKLSS